MRTLIIASVFMFYFHQVALSQDSTRILSKFEKFTSQKGTMFKIESNKLGSAGNIEISLRRATNMETGTYSLALVLSQVRTSLFTVMGAGALYIDYDEIDAVQKALNYYLEQVKTKRPKYDPDYYFTTNNNVVASCNYMNAGMFSGWSVTLYQRYEYTGGIIPRTEILVRNRDIDDLVESINKAKTSTKFD